MAKKQTTEQILEQLVKEGSEHARRAAQQQLALIKAARAQERAAAAAERSAVRTANAAEQIRASAEEERQINNMQFRGAASSYASSQGMPFGGAARVIGGTAMRLGGNLFEIMFPTLSRAVSSISTAFNQSVKDYQDQKRQNEAINQDLEDISNKLDFLDSIDDKLENISDYLKNLKNKGDGDSTLENIGEGAIALGAMRFLPQILTAIAGITAAAGLGYLAYKGYQYLTGQGDQATPVEKPLVFPPEPTLPTETPVTPTPNSAAQPTAKPDPTENTYGYTPPEQEQEQKQQPPASTGKFGVINDPGGPNDGMRVEIIEEKPNSYIVKYPDGNIAPTGKDTIVLDQKQGSLQQTSNIIPASYGGDETNAISERLSFKARDILFNADRMVIAAQNFGIIKSNQALKAGDKPSLTQTSYGSNNPSSNILGLNSNADSPQSANLTTASITPNLGGFGGFGGGMGYGGGAGLGGNGSTEEAMNFFMSRGWSREQAAGIVGNLQAESGANLKINAVGDGGKAYGIAQWHPDRQAKFQEVMGKPIRQSNFQEQLQFIDWELKNTEKKAGDALKQATTAEQAAVVVDSMYERSAGYARGQRINNAATLLKQDALKQTKSESGAQEGSTTTPSQQDSTQSPSGGGSGAQMQPASPDKGAQLQGASENYQAGATGADAGAVNALFNTTNSFGQNRGYDANFDSNVVGPVWISADLEKEIYSASRSSVLV